MKELNPMTNQVLDKLMDEMKTKWFSRPISNLLETADLSDTGLAYDRLLCDSRTVALAICIVPKDSKTKALFEEELLRTGVKKNERSLLESKTLLDIMSYESAFKTTLFYAFQNPDTMMYVSFNPDQIQALEAMFLKNATPLGQS